MEKRILGNGLEVSAVGLGCMGMTHTFGAAADKQEMTRIIQAAVEHGYTFACKRCSYEADSRMAGTQRLLDYRQRLRTSGLQFQAVLC